MESRLKAQRTQTEVEQGDGHKEYEHQAFPKYLYNAEGGSLLVQSAQEMRAVDKAVWKESPADFNKPFDIDKAAKKALDAGAQDK